jgi:hypothetical protein
LSFVWDSRFSQRWKCGLWSSGLWHHIDGYQHFHPEGRGNMFLHGIITQKTTIC